MIKELLSAMAIGCLFCACDSGTAPPPAAAKPDNQSKVVPVDYTLGRTMNARLGRGINLGNSWDSDGADDSGWGNPIRDEDFAIIKAAGFNSVRIPVRWQTFSDTTTHTVDPERLNGVIQDIQLAMANGLAVVVNFHHYNELNCYGGGMPPGYNNPPDDNPTCDYLPIRFNTEKAHFLGMWAQVATALNAAFPANDMLVFEILNEPVVKRADVLNQIMTEAYTVIRTAAPGKTIMFESYHAAKFADLTDLQLPADGNIIYSGHYYAPYAYSHQGHHGYKCKGDEAYGNNASDSLRYYKNLAYRQYPDINGTDQVPLNMGEFGVAGGSFMGDCVYYDDKGQQIGLWPSDQKKAEWAQKTVQAAIETGTSFHYWGFTHTGGFEAYNKYAETWYPGFPQALTQP